MTINQKQLIADIKKHYGFSVSRLVALSGFYDKNYKVSVGGRAYFLKIYGFDKLPSIIFQIDLISKLAQAGFPVAAIIKTLSGERLSRCCGHYGVLHEFLPGRQLRKIKINSPLMVRLGELLGRMHKIACKKRFLGKTWKKYPWDLSQFRLVVADYSKIEKILPKDISRLIESVISEWRRRSGALSRMRKGIAHNDFHGGNILIGRDQRVTVIDFGDAGRAWYAADVAVAMAHLCFLGSNHDRLTAAFLRGYEKSFHLLVSEAANLILLMRMRAATYIVETSLFMRGRRHELYNKTMVSQVKLLRLLDKA